MGYTPENQILFPECNPFTSPNTVEIVIFLENVECRLPTIITPPIKNNIPVKMKRPTITGRLFTVSFMICCI